MTDQKYKNILREILEEKIGEKTGRRDFLIENERKMQKKWEERKVFEVDKGDGNSPKFFATFPYPYMNGRLHLGHVFTISKACFASFYYRLKGRRSLFPFAFHCTGMPIKACADKLKRELEIYGPGGPPPPSEDELERQREEIKETLKAELEPKPSSKPSSKSPSKPPSKSPSKPHEAHEAGASFHSHKAKAAAKATEGKTQWDIMRSLGLTDDQIVLFTDPLHWLHYFPPLCMEDLKRFGAGVDWRRSFITTELNKYYDSFVRWQFETLRDLGKIDFGKRYSIYSPLDGQPCLDHDRSEGENVMPQEFSLIKLLLLSPLPSFSPPPSFYVYLVAATLRPETMYGQTNCWVHPDGLYGAFQINDREIFICSDRSARNMAYQGLSVEEGKVRKMGEIKGEELIGAKVKAPLSQYDEIFVLPMLTVSMFKGTGIVTSVPSDSPDDFAALRDLLSKPLLRSKFPLLLDHMVAEYRAVPIIRTEMGDMTAVKLVEDMKIKSQNDRELLALAKDKCYLLGFYGGVLLTGPFAGMKVEHAKDLIREEMIKEGMAVKYAEPEKQVISRSGDDCVVALVDQWFLTYNDPSWKSLALLGLEGMRTYNEETRHMFEKTIGWLNQWACSRSFGLGSHIPWDPSFLIESLSDSTLYMAYYSIAHLLQGDIEGTRPGAMGMSPDTFTRSVWDFLLLHRPLPPLHPLREDKEGMEKMEGMREEFEYWYPLDLRVSGKDLIPNHLTFAIFNHVALLPPSLMIQGIRANGHLLLNNKKMSKNTGNFLTLFDALDLFGADATRFALAEAGDTLDDANFSSSSANKAVLSLYNSIHWSADFLSLLRSPSSPLSSRSTTEKSPEVPIGIFIADKTFESQVNRIIVETEKAYEKMNYREALNLAFFEMRCARDEYRARIGSMEGMNGDLVLRFLSVQSLLMTPITPHWSELLFSMVWEGKKGLVVESDWPEVGPIDQTLITANEHLITMIEEFRKKISNQKVKPSRAVISVASHHPPFHLLTLSLLRSLFSEGKLSMETATEKIKSDQTLKAHASRAIPLARSLLERAKEEGERAFEEGMEYNEREYIEANLDHLQRSLAISLTVVEEPNPGASKANAIPLHPVLSFPK